ncbi:hypothetical protein TSUD_139030 [Trifolium subterraneum]|uniref:Uncharacterized protein n=1 Tax=Trifolium subterraneum TaxID=3900 RepID=A0A2Z6NL30_TRISU|nr:hypothetical protein TSUD_139030 [Trifolium subterraneum]
MVKHSKTNKNIKVKKLILFKVDFEKAYDSLMDKMNFFVKWRQWIMTCVSTTTASVLVNSSPTEDFCMDRGLQQGDPLSLFLFLIAAEGLNVMLKASVDIDLFKGYQIGNEDINVITVSHLQFADDTLILGERSWANSCGNARLHSFWAPLVEKIREGMWCKVLKAKYGLIDDQVDSGGSRYSRWWKDTISIRNGDDADGGSWFGDHIERIVGNGESTSFWKDEWLDGESLKSTFGRLFDLCLNKDVSVVDMRRLRWGPGGNGWMWRRRLFAWE